MYHLICRHGLGIKEGGQRFEDFDKQLPTIIQAGFYITQIQAGFYITQSQLN